MSSRRSYSRESRSYYSRSSSSSRRNNNSSYDTRRPLSSLLIERDFSPPLSSSIGLDFFDDPFFFQRRSRDFFDDDFNRRIRWRFNDDLFDREFFKRKSLDLGSNIPINNYREYNNSSSITRTIPVQYQPSSTNRREIYKKIDNNTDWTTNSFQRNDQSFTSRENRSSTDDWRARQESPTRKRTSMTIFVRQPRIQYSDVPHHQRTMSTPAYPSSNTTN